MLEWLRHRSLAKNLPPVAAELAETATLHFGQNLLSHGFLRDVGACLGNQSLDARHACDVSERHFVRMFSPLHTMRIGLSVCAHCGSYPRVE